MNKEQILELADKCNGERTYFEGELISVTFAVANLEKFAELYKSEIENELFGISEELEQQPVVWPNGMDSDDIAAWLKDHARNLDPYVQGPLMRTIACFIESTPLYKIKDTK